MTKTAVRLESVKLSQIVESKTNPRGAVDPGTLQELLASVRTQGILTPVILRPHRLEKTGAGETGQYELVAGRRRYAAAKLANLIEIPATIQELTDEEAREVQIVENLQREGIHPLEEAAAFRALAANAKEMTDVAVRVGKSPEYVRSRLVLTNLDEKLAAAYRKGEMNDGMALLIAGLAPSDQHKAWKVASGSVYNRMTVRDMKDWIARSVGEPMKRQPWIGDAQFEKIVGACQECKPNVATLFGDVKTGECTSFQCWNRKMKAYVAHMAAAGAAKVSTLHSHEDKKLPGTGDYHRIEGRKDICPSVQDAVVADGAGVGTLTKVCIDKSCRVHAAKITPGGFKRTPEEEKKRKQELARERLAKEKKAKVFNEALAKVSWPLSERHLDALLAFIFQDRGSMYQQAVIKLLGDYCPVGKDKNYERALRDWAGKDKAGKLRLVIAMMFPTYSADTAIKEL